MAVVDWPTVSELAQVLNVDNVGDWTVTLDRVLEAAITRVKLDVGNWEEYDDFPDENLAQAALRMAELISQRPEAAEGRVTDPVYLALLFGHRRSFGFA